MLIKNGKLISADGMIIFNYRHTEQSAHDTVMFLHYPKPFDYSQLCEDISDSLYEIETAVDFTLY
jgi:hypothetical protein